MILNASTAKTNQIDSEFSEQEFYHILYAVFKLSVEMIHVNCVRKLCRALAFFNSRIFDGKSSV